MTPPPVAASDPRARIAAGPHAPDRIPRQFTFALCRFIFVAYRDRFWHQLPLALTLGGVFASLPAVFLASIDPGYLWVVSLSLPLFLVPALAVWRLDRDTHRTIVQRWARHAPIEVLLFYFAYHVRALLREVQYLDALLQRLMHRQARRRKPQYPTKEIRKGLRRIRSRISDLEFLANVLWTPLTAPSRSFLLFDLCQLRPSRLLRTMDVYRRAVRQFVDHSETDSSAGTYDSSRRGAARGVVQASHTVVERLVGRALRVTEPSIVRPALQVVTQIGTTRMVQELADALADIWADVRVPSLDRLATAEMLLSTVETIRTGGNLARILLDLPDALDRTAYASDADIPIGPESLELHRTQREAASSAVSEQMVALIQAEHATHRRVAIATIGYSTTILDGLARSRSSVGPVFVLQLDAQTAEADELMRAELEDHGIEAAILSLETEGLLDSRLEDVRFAFFGFEAANLRGEIVHRRGLEAVLRPIATFVRKTGATVYAVGESWKVRDFRASVTDGSQEERHPTVTVASGMIYRPLIEFRILTDCGPHTAVDITPQRAVQVAPQPPVQVAPQPPVEITPQRYFSLECCRDKWARRNEPSRPRGSITRAFPS